MHATDKVSRKFFELQSLSPSSKYDHDRYSVSEKILLLSRHVELNPGPSTIKEINNVTFPAATDLEMRLHQFGFRPLDVCGAGDCFFLFFFFRSVLHQLYGNPSYYDFIRAAGIHILRQNTVRSIESDFQLSWMHYLTSKFCPSTWADGIIIQAVADASNLKAHTQILWK